MTREDDIRVMRSFLRNDIAELEEKIVRPYDVRLGGPTEEDKKLYREYISEMTAVINILRAK